MEGLENEEVKLDSFGEQTNQSSQTQISLNQQQLIYLPKVKHYKFKFFLSDSRQQKDPFLHDLIGLPTAPLIGRYNRNGYSIDDVQGFVCFNCLLPQQTNLQINNNWVQLTIQDQGVEKTIYMPREVIQKVVDIPLRIKHNKAKNKNPAKNKGKNQNQNQNLKFNQQNQPKQAIPDQFDYNPFQYRPFQNIKFMWSISFSVQSQSQVLYSQNQNAYDYQNQNKKKNINQQNSNNNNPLYKNIIIHTLFFNNIDFSQRKRLVMNIPMSVIVPNESSEDCGVMEYEDETKAILFNQMRSEYISVHMIKGSLALSPNNLRLVFNDETNVISHFWTVFLQEQTEHIICYNWEINTMQEHFSQILSDSFNIEQLIDGFANILGQQHNAIVTAKKIFMNQ